jgi:hypothetical protein
MSDLPNFFSWMTQQRGVTVKGGPGSGRYPKGSGDGDEDGSATAEGSGFSTDHIDRVIGDSKYKPTTIKVLSDSEMPGQNDPTMQHTASYRAIGDTLSINKDSEYYKMNDEDRKAYALKMHRTKKWSTPDPDHPLNHELGHAAHAKNSPKQYSGRGDISGDQQDIAYEVSGGAMYTSHEFVAETFAGLRYGKKYSDKVMKLYDDFGGPADVN